MGGKTPLVVAVQVTKKGPQVVLWMSRVSDFHKQDLHSWAQYPLQPGTVAHSDGQAYFGAVQDISCEHRSVVTGGGPQSCQAGHLMWVNTMLGNVKQSLVGTCHAFDSKYLSRYFAGFSYRFNYRYDLSSLVPQLAYVAVQTPPSPYHL